MKKILLIISSMIIVSTISCYYLPIATWNRTCIPCEIKNCERQGKIPVMEYNKATDQFEIKCYTKKEFDKLDGI